MSGTVYRETGDCPARPTAATPAQPAECLSGSEACTSNAGCFNCLGGCDNCYAWAARTMTNANPLPGITPAAGSPLLQQWPWAQPTDLACPFTWQGDATQWNPTGQPGLPTCPRLDAALRTAGWIPLPQYGPSNPPPAGPNMLALVSKPAFGECRAGEYAFGNVQAHNTTGDMHFVRQEADGTWSQKPGDGDLRTTDCGGTPLGTDPWHADYRLWADEHGLPQGCGVDRPTDACPLGQTPSMSGTCVLPTYEYLPCGYYAAPPDGVKIEGPSPGDSAADCFSIMQACGNYEQVLGPDRAVQVYQCPTE